MGDFRIATWREEKASWALSVRASILSAVDVDVICPAVSPPAAVTSPQEENVIPNWEIKTNHFSSKLFLVVLCYHSKCRNWGIHSLAAWYSFVCT